LTPATPGDLFRMLNQLGIKVAVHEHPPLRTVQQSKALRGDLPGGHCKNLFLRDHKKRNYLVVTLEDRPIDLATLAGKIGSGRLSFATSERLMEFLGVEPGAVTPFALINDATQSVAVALDAGMLKLSPLNYHPLVNTMTVAIAAADLLKFIRACGHGPTVVELD
jgi:Ala-tRNA(Pro) deacylase